VAPSTTTLPPVVHELLSELESEGRGRGVRVAKIAKDYATERRRGRAKSDGRTLCLSDLAANVSR